MQARYQEIAGRFREERERLGMTQEEFSRKLYMSQGHYCKAEQGKKRFTHNELQRLMEVGVDLHYVYTGERLIHSEYYTFFTGCGPEEIRCLAGMTLPVLIYSLRRLPPQEGEALCRRIRHENYIIVRDRQEENCLYQLRRYNFYSQRYMAEQLGVDVKKYASLEKNRRFGDSELLLRVYDCFGISPLIMLNAGNGIAHEMCALLEHLGEKESGRYFAYIRLACEKLLARPQ